MTTPSRRAEHNGAGADRGTAASAAPAGAVPFDLTPLAHAIGDATIAALAEQARTANLAFAAYLADRPEMVARLRVLGVI